MSRICPYDWIPRAEALCQIHFGVAVGSDRRIGLGVDFQLVQRAKAQSEERWRRVGRESGALQFANILFYNVNNLFEVSLNYLEVARRGSTVDINSVSLTSRASRNSKAISVPVNVELQTGIRLLNTAVATSLVLLSNDVALNPGPAAESLVNFCLQLLKWNMFGLNRHVVLDMFVEVDRPG